METVTFLDLDNSAAILRYYQIAELSKTYGQNEVYNNALERIEELSKTDFGKVLVMPLRDVPVPSGVSSENALTVFENNIKEKGIVYTYKTK